MYKPYRPTDHAEERRLEMGLGTKEIKRTLNHPQVVYPCSPNQPGDRTMYLGERITLVVDNPSGKVITILWRTEDEWTRDDKADLVVIPR